MKTDIEIANSIEIKPIYEIADKLGIDRDLLEPYGRYKAKLPLSLIDKSKIDGKKIGTCICHITNSCRRG